MKNKVSPLFSRYILEGQLMEETPFSALYDVLDGNGTVQLPEGPFEDVIDEYMDKAPQEGEYDPKSVDEYCQKILQSPFDRKKVNLDYPVSWTISAVNALLLESLFKTGEFTLTDMLLMAKWDWNNAPAGNLAAFYDSTVTLARYLSDLGLKLDRFFVEENRRSCVFDITVRSGAPSRRKCHDKFAPASEDSEIIYIPFCQNRYQLGGSALCMICGNGNGVEPDLNDPEYFADCYEVVRELVEDSIVLSGLPVQRGGLMTAVEKFRGRKGLTLNLDGIMAATGETDIVKILFSEIPGVLLQVPSRELEYIDSQCLLQEIAYYPLGRPSSEFSALRVEHGRHDALASILSSLLNQPEDEE